MALVHGRAATARTEPMLSPPWLPLQTRRATMHAERLRHRAAAPRGRGAHTQHAQHSTPQSCRAGCCHVPAAVQRRGVHAPQESGESIMRNEKKKGEIVVRAAKGGDT